MSTKYLFLLGILLCAITSWSQYSSPHATSVTGGAAVVGDIQLQWTMGESVILTLEGPAAQLTCGLHQSDTFCFGDFNFDGQINTEDILILLGQWLCVGNCVADMNADGAVDTTDVLLLLGTFGTSCYGVD